MTQRRSGMASNGPPGRTSAVGGAYAPRAQLPGWFWALLGCMSVLVIGFAGLWWATSVGMIPGPGGGRAAVAGREDSGRGAAKAPKGARIQVEPIAAAVMPEPLVPVPPPPRSEARRVVPHPRPAVVASAPRPAKLAVPKPGVPAGAAAPVADSDAPTGDEAAPAARAGAPKKDKADKAPEDGSPAEASSMPAVLREISGPDDTPRQREAPKALVEAALNALGPRVRRCFFKFQIPGRAQVGLVVTPAGEAESVTVSGDFEGTPTGECIANEVEAAALPRFNGAPMRLNYTYVLR
jgi:hypothetical protein